MQENRKSPIPDNKQGVSTNSIQSPLKLKLDHLSRLTQTYFISNDLQTRKIFQFMFKFSQVEEKLHHFVHTTLLITFYILGYGVQHYVHWYQWSSVTGFSLFILTDVFFLLFMHSQRRTIDFFSNHLITNLS